MNLFRTPLALIHPFSLKRTSFEAPQNRPRMLVPFVLRPPRQSAKRRQTLLNLTTTAKAGGAVPRSMFYFTAYIYYIYSTTTSLLAQDKLFIGSLEAANAAAANLGKGIVAVLCSRLKSYRRLCCCYISHRHRYIEFYSHIII